MSIISKALLLFTLLTAVLSFSTQIAHDLAHLSEVAYSPLDKINSWTCGECSKFAVKGQKAFFSSTANIQGYVAYYVKENAILIGFRGSVDFKNWVYNLNTVSVNYPGCSGCSVHAGFYSAFNGVAPTVRTQVANLLATYKSAKIIVTGHSLGGAMAIHTALDMKSLHGHVEYVYTFGQPRVGNQAFATFYESRIPNTFRVVNYADMVPHVPPSAFTFKHGGHEMWYNPRGMKTYKTCVSEDPNCANSIGSTSMSTDDHQLSYYMTLAVGTSFETKDLIRKQPEYSSEQLSQAELRKVMLIKQVIEEEMKENGEIIKNQVA